MTAHELTDPAGGALTITRDGDTVWITATEGQEEVTVGPFPTTIITTGDLMDGGVTSARVEQEARRDDIDPLPILDEVARLDGELHDARAMAALWKETARRAINIRDIARMGREYYYTGRKYYKARVEKAEQERDDALSKCERLRTVLATTARQRDQADMHLPLTADDITDEMVDRAMFATYNLTPESSRSDYWADEREDAHSILAAALTEPPARPEGAEAVQAVLDAVYDGGQKVNHRGQLADALAERGVRAGGES